MKEKVFTPERWVKVNKENKELLEDFLIEIRSNKYSRRTIEQYDSDMRMVLTYIMLNMNNKSILELTKKDFRRIKMWYLDVREVSTARCCRVISTIHSLLDFAEDDDDYDYDFNLSRKVKGVTIEKTKEIIFLTDAQIDRLRSALFIKKEYMLMTFVDVLYDSGGRRNEVLQIKRDGLLDRNNTNIVNGKGGKQFPLLYFKKSKESLKLYLNTREDDLDCLWICGKKDNIREASYTTLYQFILKIREVLCMTEKKSIPINVHTFRHSCIQNLRDGSHRICKELGKKDGFSLEEIKTYVNHSDTSTTESYLKNDRNELIEKAFKIKIS